MSNNLIQRLKTYLQPGVMVWSSLKFQWRTFLQRTQHWTRDHAFAEWFDLVGPDFAKYESTTVVPRLVSTVEGTGIDLGAAIGSQLTRFNAANITHVYGVEPNVAFLPVLEKKIEEKGFQGKYTPVICGIEDSKILETYGITEQSLDFVVSTQVLCSVQDPTEVVKRIHALLKPGGMLVFWEHGRSSDWLTRQAQRFWRSIWWYAIGGCRMGLPIKDILLGAAQWELVEFVEEDERLSLLPRTWGRLRKPYF